MTSTLKTNAIEPEGGTTNMVVGESGQNTVIGNNDIRANVLQDSGGNALFTSNGSGVLSGVSSGLGSPMVLLSTQTASNSASISFTSGIDSTYKEYIFRFYNINPTADAVFQWQVDANGGSNGYNDINITSTFFRAYHLENGSASAVNYLTGNDEAQTTAYADLLQGVTNGSDRNGNGELHLFNPASTTYVKQWHSHMTANDGAYCGNNFVGGYWNTTAAINAASFKFASGNFDGVIKLWGVK